MYERSERKGGGYLIEEKEGEERKAGEQRVSTVN